MARRNWPTKDPNDILDYRVDWSRWLESGDAIDTATFSLTTAAGLTIQSQSNDTTTASCWLINGTDGETAEILCRIVTTGGRQRDHTGYLAIAERR